MKNEDCMPGATSHIRVPADLAEKLGWIVKLRKIDFGGSWCVSCFADQHLRQAVEEEYSTVAIRVVRIKKALDRKSVV